MSQVKPGYFRVYEGTREVFATKDLDKLTEHILKNWDRYRCFKRDFVRYLLYTDSGDVVYNSRVQVFVFTDSVAYYLRNCQTTFISYYGTKKKE